jgi:hypothetical protein
MSWPTAGDDSRARKRRDDRQTGGARRDMRGGWMSGCTVPSRNQGPAFLAEASEPCFRPANVETPTSRGTLMAETLLHILPACKLR